MGMGWGRGPSSLKMEPVWIKEQSHGPELEFSKTAPGSDSSCVPGAYNKAVCETYAVSDVLAVKEKQEGLAVEARGMEANAFKAESPEHVRRLRWKRR